MRRCSLLVTLVSVATGCSDGIIGGAGANGNESGPDFENGGTQNSSGAGGGSAGRSNGSGGVTSNGSGGRSQQGAGGGSDRGSGGAAGGGTVIVPPGLETVPGNAIDAPAAEAGLALPTAPAFGSAIRYVPNRSSVRLHVPAVAGAGDYRAFAVRDGVVVSSDSNSEQVNGATIFCAGLRQHNHCDGSEAISEYGRGAFYVPNCSADDRAIDVPKSVVLNIELDGITEDTTVVVEAIDELCPFPGTFGASHSDVECVYDGQASASATYNGQVVNWRLCPSRFPIRTEAEIRADYGSLIINGHGPAALPPAGESPFVNIGLPAAPVAPAVLARSVVSVSPLGSAGLPDGFTDADFFEGFDSGEQPQRVNGARIIPNSVAQNPQLHQTSQMSMYTYGAESPQFFVTQGVLRSVLPDWSQNIMGSNILYPRRAFAIPDDADHFVHVTFETQTNATERRYFWFHACGASSVGQTMVNGALAEMSGIVPSPGFMNPQEGEAVSTQGWNCIQLVPRGGGYDTLEGGLFGRRARPETDIRVVINGDESAGRQDSIVNVSPDQYNSRGNGGIDGSWMRQWDANKQVAGVMLDDEMYIEQRTKFDVYFNRGRIVVYANGLQKLCNDYPNDRLTMAEAAIGIGHVLYHSSAEREEFVRPDYIRTSQHYYRHNTPFLDHRTFDNIGVREGAELPAGFATGQCFAAN